MTTAARPTWEELFKMADAEDAPVQRSVPAPARGKWSELFAQADALEAQLRPAGVWAPSDHNEATFGSDAAPPMTEEEKQRLRDQLADEYAKGQPEAYAGTGDVGIMSATGVSPQTPDGSEQWQGRNTTLLGNIGRAARNTVVDNLPPGVVKAMGYNPDLPARMQFESAEPDTAGEFIGHAVGGIVPSTQHPESFVFGMGTAGAAERAAAPILKHVAETAGPRTAAILKGVIGGAAGSAPMGAIEEAQRNPEEWAHSPALKLGKVMLAAGSAGAAGGIGGAGFGLVGGRKGGEESAPPQERPQAQEPQGTHPQITSQDAVTNPAVGEGSVTDANRSPIGTDAPERNSGLVATDLAAVAPEDVNLVAHPESVPQTQESPNVETQTGKWQALFDAEKQARGPEGGAEPGGAGGVDRAEAVRSEGVPADVSEGPKPEVLKEAEPARESPATNAERPVLSMPKGEETPAPSAAASPETGRTGSGQPSEQTQADIQRNQAESNLPDPVSMTAKQLRAELEAGDVEVPKRTSKADMVSGVKQLRAMAHHPERGGGTLHSDIVDAAYKAINWAADHFRDNAPRVTRTAPESADALHKHAAAKVWRTTMAKRMASEVLGDLPESKRDTFGAMLVEDRLRGIKDGFTKAGDTQAAASVGTMIGKAFPDEAAYKAAWADPQLKAAAERHKATTQPELEQLHKELGGRMAAPGPEGTFVNLLRVDKDNPDTAHLRSAQPSPGENTTQRRKGSVHNMRATGTAESYSVDYADIVDNGIGDNLNRATLERFIAQAEKDNIAILAQQGKKFTRPDGSTSLVPLIDGKPAERIEVQRKGVPAFGEEGEITGARTYVQNLWVRKDLAPEIRNALTLRNENTAGLGKALQPLTWVQTKLGVDAAYHVANDIAAIANSPGAKGVIGDLARKLPGVNVVDAATRIGREYQRLVTSDTQVLKELEKIASVGALRDAGKDTGLVAKIDQASRLALNGMWDELVKRKLVEDTDAGRRTFINQVGQYNARMQPRVVRIVREMGLSPFVTAGRTFNRLGIRALKGVAGLDTGLGGGKAASTLAGVKLRLQQAVGTLVGTVALPALWNTLIVGSPIGRPGVPIGAIDTGKDYKDKPVYIDPLKWTGLRRGLRVTGAGKVVEGVRYGRPTGSIASDAITDVLGSGTHPYAGPPVQAASMLLGGETPWGFDKADLPPPGGNKYIERGKAALEQLNPVGGPLVSGLVDMATSDEPKADTAEATAESIARRFLGAAGIGVGTPPNDRARLYREWKDYKMQQRRKARARQ